MGYMFAIGPCWSCRQDFAFDPDLVPSIVVANQREPICRRCVDRANDMRRDKEDMPLIRVLPGAYPNE